MNVDVCTSLPITTAMSRLDGTRQRARGDDHEARGADATITSAIDAHIVTEQGQGDDDDDSSGALVPVG
jgi:hypothetical protein